MECLFRGKILRSDKPKCDKISHFRDFVFDRMAKL